MFNAIVNRTHSIEGWQKIPWDNPDFSRRMLKEHLSQDHDAASRRTSIIEQQVGWIHQHVLKEKASKILDLGCGPGLYSQRLAALGHQCTGIDFSPASIAYAREQSDVSYILGSVLDVPFEGENDLVMMIYGELNAFSTEEAQRIIDKAYAALKPDGVLLLEAHPDEAVERLGHEAASWFSGQSGLFSEDPYVCLQESWFEDNCATTRFYVIDAESGQTTTFISALMAYTDAAYRQMLRAFGQVDFYPSLGNEVGGDYLFGIVARR